MTSRERILKALKREIPDRIPWTPLIDGYYLSSLEKPMNQVDAIKAFGGDVFARHIPTYREAMIGGNASNLAKTTLATSVDNTNLTDNFISRSISSKGDIEIIVEETNGQITQTVQTPLGLLRSKWVRNKNSPFIPFPVEHRLKTREDLRIFKYLVENLQYEPTYDLFEKEDAYIGENGIATTTGPSTPFHILLEIEFGMENFYYILQDHKSEVEEIMELMHERNKEIYSIIAASPALVVIDYENTSTKMMSPAMYEKYCEKQINEYAEILHKSGKIFLTHMCGTLKGLEKQLARGAMDGIIDIAPPPTGDVSLVEAKKMWGSDKIVMGGIDATAFTMWSPQEISVYVKNVLQDIISADGVFLGSGDATPQGTPIENLRAVTEAVEKYGKYLLGS